MNQLMESAESLQQQDLPLVEQEKIVKIQNLISFETDEVIEIKAPSHMSDSSSVAMEMKTDRNENVRNRQIAAAKSSVERPTMAREKQKAKTANNSLILPHALGKIPNYLLKKREQGTSNNSSTAEFIARPMTESTLMSNSKIQSKIMSMPKKELQGDFESMSVVDSEELSEIEAMRKKIASQTKKILHNNTKIFDLKQKSEALENQLEETKLVSYKRAEELKANYDKIKNLEAKIGRLQKEQKQSEHLVKKIDNLEIEVTNAKKENENLNSRLKQKDEENQKMKFQLEKLKSSGQIEYDRKALMSKLELKEHENEQIKREVERLKDELVAREESYENLVADNNHIEFLLKNSSCIEEYTNGQKQQFHAMINQLKCQVESKETEIETLKEDKDRLLEEIKQSKLSENRNSNDEISKLTEKIHQMKSHENELCQRIEKLEKNLDEQNSSMLHKDAIMEIRAEYIRTLQDTENANKARILIQLTELEKLRAQIKEFEKFKEAHKEEKKNFENFVKELESEKRKLHKKMRSVEHEGSSRKNQ